MIIYEYELVLRYRQALVICVLVRYCFFGTLVIKMFTDNGLRSIDCDNCNNVTTTIDRSEEEKFRLKDLIRLQADGNRFGESLITNLHNLLENSYTVMVGAYRGLVMLQETYRLDIMEMAEGRVSYKGKVFQVRQKETSISQLNHAHKMLQNN